MVGSEPASALVGTAARRRRALAHLAPIFDLGKARSTPSVEWSSYDSISLVQVCVDTVALSSGLVGSLGTPRAAVLAEMTRVAYAMAPDHPAEEHANVARYVLDHLLRHDEPTPYFTVTYADPDAHWKTDTRQVRFLYETLAADGSTLLVNVDHTAVALLLIATNRSLEDEHEAVIAVLRAQVDSGRLDAAVESAQDALTLSRAYAANVRRLIAEAQRDVTRVDYLSGLRPELTAAEQHLDRRISMDGTLHRHLESLRSNASEEHNPLAVRQLSAAVARLDRAIDTLAALNTEVIAAPPQWRDAQAAQAFAALPDRAINPTTDVLQALLCNRDLPSGAFTSPPAPGAFLDVSALADRLCLPPRRHVYDEGTSVPAEPLEDDGVYEQFPERFHSIAHVLRIRRIVPGMKARLTELLTDADTLFSHSDVAVVTELTALADGNPDTARRRLRLLLALDALMLWHPDNEIGPHDDWWAIDDGIRRSLPDLVVPDLLIHRKAVPHDRT
ncbi:hypothetical protein ABZ953_08235 [Streptomyces sp. NPDC046465]|uniref:hypothetical protein n=1 Tax=Streptomyces sp. NPDC046465 TaxID=3155810 RepID=UPI0033FCCEB9